MKGHVARDPYKGDSRRLLLAFDIGTTFSGISYSILDPGNVPEIKPVTRFPDQERVGGDVKVPTVIYYDAKGNPAAIGAGTLKDGIEADAEDEGWAKAYWFKLHLRPETPSASRYTIDPLSGMFRMLSVTQSSPDVPPLPPNKTVVDVFSDYMKYLFRCSQAYISDTHGANVWESLKDDIMFVLTHPNGWFGPQQAQMREAGLRAGLVPNENEGKTRISFVTEGEASLHFCLENGLDVKDSAVDDKLNSAGVLIVDAGGGTIDVTSYRKLKDHFEEIAIPTCFFQGSIFVTQRAEAHLKGLLSNTRFEGDIDAIVTRFDRNTKHVFRDDTEHHHIQFTSHRERDPKLGVRGGRLTLEGQTVAGFFEPSVQCIVDAIKDQVVTSHYPITSVFLVGGFSASNWLFEKVKDGVADLSIPVSRPDAHTNKAVSNGAVSYYLDSAVKSRMSRFTYGVPSSVPFLPELLPSHLFRLHKVRNHPITGEAMLPVFSAILLKNKAVSAQQEFRKGFSVKSFSSAATTFSLELISYSALPPNTHAASWLWHTFMDEEPEMYQEVCTIEADLTSVEKQKKYSVANGMDFYETSFEVVLLFGLTELKAQIAWTENGVEKRGPVSIVYGS